MDFKVVAANLRGFEIGDTVTRDELEEAGANVDALAASGHVEPVGACRSGNSGPAIPNEDEEDG